MVRLSAIALATGPSLIPAGTPVRATLSVAGPGSNLHVHRLLASSSISSKKIRVKGWIASGPRAVNVRKT
jgi:hypothetical protein